MYVTVLVQAVADGMHGADYKAANICTHCQPLENHMGRRCLLSICNKLITVREVSARQRERGQDADKRGLSDLSGR